MVVTRGIGKRADHALGDGKPGAEAAQASFMAGQLIELYFHHIEPFYTA
ncbi:hypothetical protein MRBBS_3179 [Marinobacter sp. BSs20148]|nr:hypothetical protein MRBBS_3179 [Marinobacter sp. BSs20148]